MEKYEQNAFQIITNVGMAKSSYMQAINEAKSEKFKESEDLISEGNQFLIDGHKVHKDLIQAEASGETVPMTLLLMHAEDQLISTEIIKEMAKELIYVHQNYVKK
ncbi:PTS lactose/cellobiose transporter subunit IIA [Mammaliicoccus fleurettii]|uniref:PTS lactose/cellobiose transporter subunit IIA n=1 Tax=Mammaliicoccus fleurettii TaxID=150056 RepID=A0ABS5ML57_9STAP|nr:MULTISPECIES: PTS lactose/cellobiose transporter subunit IIA [Mammaliicoccus]MBL0846326.1 PTS lactose/cellobiose transporter subunit IIA [Mammaliicoccus fleurettii]MBS3671402.1 PTS lactose/cellobiose transporter subunit IIA [Mammaliicoccus fleurettii]MBS3696644.1 PTS lactose/cellobiose transporter subunit IIA [Mammaliicoccus fleurettii]MEB6201075.1 PTS lactose/cellobiose transporter subunit IIA [Mammaliicoccus fleurettii]